MAKQTYFWTHFSDKLLLETPVSELGLSLKNHPLMELIQKLSKELELKGIPLKPKVYLSDDWFCADGTTTFAIPFTLLHPRLKKLEEDYLGEMEGGNDEWFMKLARHEMGHVLDNAFELRNSNQRTKLFGDGHQPYPETYDYKPYSKSYVRHIEDGYAQSHPDEDWAETFAVWLTPNLDWEKQYSNWPALKKLKFVNNTFKKKVINKTPFLENEEMPHKLEEMSLTLKEYLEQKRARLFPKRNHGLPKTDRPIFFKKSLSNKLPLASTVIKKNKKFYSQVIKRETDQYLYRVNQALDLFMADCDRLKWTIHPTATKRPKYLAKILATQVNKIIQGGHHRIIM
ncbi:MAG: hypothetical protein CME68_10840 [Halobacteriovoraceae bacterium]|nr:hypothetical protein [Halobacteriovoraceae bacterium]